MIMKRFTVAVLAAAALLGEGATAFAGPQPDAPPKPSEGTEKLLHDLGAAAAWLDKVASGPESPEAVRMFLAITRGSQMGPGDGWFGPTQTPYTWDWLARRHGKDAADGITKDRFQGPEAWFARLDRDRDGRITPDDLDWSDASAYVRQSAMARQWARAMDRNGDGKVSAEEWEAFFKKAAGDGGALTPDDLRAALFPPPAPRRPGNAPSGPSAGTLLAGMFSGELGSIFEGPKVGEKAPDFTLKTADGKQEYSPSRWRGEKPVVLVFGSFT
jgi:hypothetical protein